MTYNLTASKRVIITTQNETVGPQFSLVLLVTRRHFDFTAFDRPNPKGGCGDTWMEMPKSLCDKPRCSEDSLPSDARNGRFARDTSTNSNPAWRLFPISQTRIPRRAYFLVLARNIEDTGIFIRTFYFNGEMSRNRMRDASSLLKQSSTDYFTNLKT